MSGTIFYGLWMSSSTTLAHILLCIFFSFQKALVCPVVPLRLGMYLKDPVPLFEKTQDHHQLAYRQTDNRSHPLPRRGSSGGGGP